MVKSPLNYGTICQLSNWPPARFGKKEPTFDLFLNFFSEGQGFKIATG